MSFIRDIQGQELNLPWLHKAHTVKLNMVITAIVSAQCWARVRGMATELYNYSPLKNRDRFVCELKRYMNLNGNEKFDGKMEWKNSQICRKMIISPQVI